MPDATVGRPPRRRPARLRPTFTHTSPQKESPCRFPSSRSDRIVVQGIEAEQTTASGLVIPDTAKEKPQEGEVVAVGPGRFNEDGDERIPMDISVGDRVLYSKYGGTEVKHGGQEYLILSARDVLAIVG